MTILRNDIFFGRDEIIGIIHTSVIDSDRKSSSDFMKKANEHLSSVISISSVNLTLMRTLLESHD